ncbi:MAG: AAA family ATPase [Erysipelotrichaceae bacterium]|nr:AAA family ATPase [Erysipelotrichaceae bacterium]
MEPIAINITDFKELIDNHYYYIDKTLFIKDVVDEYIVFYQRPYHFGKSLNMSMLYYFFSINEKDNAYLFNDLEISKEKDVMKHQNQYPVLYISLKNMKGDTFAQQVKIFSQIISDLCHQYQCPKDSSFLQKEFLELYNGTNDIVKLDFSLYYLTKCLKQYYHKSTIILIDDYDTPYINAYQNGFYDDTKKLLESVFTAVFKGNDLNLEKGILTGVYKIPRGTDFGGGFNNHSEYDVTDIRSSSRFGFKYDEVHELLKYYHLESCYDEVLEWYGGYRVKNTYLFNTSSVLNYVSYALNGEMEPQVFFHDINDMISHYINEHYLHLYELESLINEGTIADNFFLVATYDQWNNRNHIFNFLLYGGYLRIKEYIDRSLGIYELPIPNKEVKEIYINIYKKWFKSYADAKISDLMKALDHNDVTEVMNLMSDIFVKTIKYYDNYEDFCFNLLCDIFNKYNIKTKRNKKDKTFEISITSNHHIILRCQISNGIRYLRSDSQKMIDNVDSKYVYGIAFYGKSCFVTGNIQ